MAVNHTPAGNDSTLNNPTRGDALAPVEVVATQDQADLIEHARVRFIEVVTQAQQEKDYARVVLTGGGAGIGLLKSLAQDSSVKADDGTSVAIDWSRVLIFFGDERFVAADSDDRNEKQAREALLDQVSVPEEHIFGYRSTELTGDGAELSAEAEAAAQDYSQVLAEHAVEGFDLHLLGMGEEGHINSLFPHTAELAEETELVVPVHNCPKPPPNRISLTKPAISLADQVWLLVSGAAKAEAAQQVIVRGDAQQWPAAGVSGKQATVLFIDQAALAR